MTPARAFREQAVHCEALGSPFMARLMRLFADRLHPGSPVADRILGWTGDPQASADSVPLRTAGALHALVLDGDDLGRVYPPNEVGDDALWTAVEAALRDQPDHLLDWLSRAPQTNEVRRSAVVLPALLHLSRASGVLPVHLIELGTSGGLNLRADRFRLCAGGRDFGNPDSGVVLEPDWTGPPPPVAPLAVATRTGIDIAPVDPKTPAGARTLLSYLWPDQPDRISRTRAAIEIARAHPARILAGDAAHHLEAILSDPLPAGLTVVFHTVAWQYFPTATKTAARAAVERAGARATPAARLAWFAMETDGGRGAGLTLRAWPGGGGEIALGRADFHGRWIDWTPDHAVIALALGW